MGQIESSGQNLNVCRSSSDDDDDDGKNTVEPGNQEHYSGKIC